MRGFFVHDVFNRKVREGHAKVAVALLLLKLDL